MIDDETRAVIEHELERASYYQVARPDVAIARLIACINLLLQHKHE